MDLTHRTLDEVDRLWREGRIDVTEVREYLRLWNTTAMRFTVAYIADGRIRQRPKRDDE